MCVVIAVPPMGARQRGGVQVAGGAGGRRGLAAGAQPARHQAGRRAAGLQHTRHGNCYSTRTNTHKHAQTRTNTHKRVLTCTTRKARPNMYKYAQHALHVYVLAHALILTTRVRLTMTCKVKVILISIQ